MIQAFLYDADGEDREISLEDALPDLEEQHLLWVDLIGRDAEEVARLGGLLGLEARSVCELRCSRRTFALNNYGEYFQFDVPTFATKDAGKGGAPKVPRGIKLDFVVGRQWLLTGHDDEIAFLTGFREQDRGETLIGNLSPASLAASLLDWHLTRYLPALGQLAPLGGSLSL